MNFATSMLAATVHFVGIIAFIPEPPNSATLRPSSMPAPAPVSQNRVSGAQDHGVRLAGIRPPSYTAVPINQPAVLGIIPHDFPKGIPTHVAMILYRATDYVGSSGLSRSPLARDGLEYVTINSGDVVTFDTGGATNPPVAFPAALPHHPARSNTPQLSLLTPYDPNDRQHASLVRISAGTLSVCQDNGRYDTTVTMTAKGSFVIKFGTQTQPKTLILKTGAELSIVNVPPTYATSLQDDDPDMNHYMEYCVMAGIATDPTHCPMPHYGSNTTCAFPGQNMLVTPPSSGTGKRPGGAMPLALKGGAYSTQGAMADCSNTQWP